MDRVINAVEVRLVDKEPLYKKVQLNFGNRNVFPANPEGGGPVLYLSPSSDRVFLQDHSNIIGSIGNKNKHKGLAYYFLKHKGHTVPLLNGVYSSFGKLSDSLGKYLGRCIKENGPERGIVLISHELFEEVWKSAELIEPLLTPDDSLEYVKQDDLNANDSSESYLLRRLSAHVNEPPSLSGKYIGHAESVQLVRKQIVVASGCEIPVLVLGDTGTGKEIVAREVHLLSERRTQPFKAINCGAISKELLEVELFGCEKDVVGPGYPQRTGIWEAAGSGTLFLDEIGDLSPDHQVKILRALQENSARRVGGIRDISLQARIIAASNKDLFSLAKSGRFRFDLYYRLNGIPIRTPRLRDHIEDVATLAQSLWSDITQDEEAYLSSEVLEFLMKYPWPGNVRELRMVLSGLFALYHAARPTERDMQDAFLMQGLCLHDHVEIETGEDPIHSHRVVCLQHLKAVYAVFHGLITQLEENTAADLGENPAIESGVFPYTFTYLAHELTTLCKANSIHFFNGHLADECQLLSSKINEHLDAQIPIGSVDSMIDDLKKVMTEVSETIVSLLQGAR